jgi:LysM repeat protein
MTKKINYGQAGFSIRNGHLGLILVLLLLALLVFSFWYPRDDGQTYGDVALLDAQEFKSKALQKVRGVYQCATQGCNCKVSDLVGNQLLATTGTTTNGGEIIPPPKQDPADVSNSSATTFTTEDQKLPVPHISPIFTPEIMNNAASLTPYSNASSASQGTTGTPPPAKTAPMELPFSVVTPSAQVVMAPASRATPPSAEQSPQAYSAVPSQKAPFVGTYQQQSGQPLFPTADSSYQPSRNLLAARQLLAEKRYQEAIAHYRKQLFENPDDVDAYGELGNMHLLTQHYVEAAQNYYEAATRLLDHGFPNIVAPLLPVIERFEPLLANLLRQKAAQNDR